MKFSLKLSHKALILITVPLLFETAFLVTLFVMLEQAHSEIEQERTFLVSFNRLFGAMIGVTAALSRYAVTDDPRYLERYRAVTESFPATVRKLKEFASKHIGLQKEALPLLEGFETAGLEMIKTIDEATVTADEGVNPVRSFTHLYRVKKWMKQLVPAAEKFALVTAQGELGAEPAESRAKRRLNRLLLAAGAGNVLLAVLLTLYFNRGTTRRLSIVMDNTQRLAKGQLLNPPVGGTDEIAELDRVFKEMADALAAAAQKERAIIDNAADVICSLDAHGVFTAVSPACRQMWGFSPQELIGRKFTDILLNKDGDFTQDAPKGTAGGTNVFSFETEVRHKEGKSISTLWSAQWSAPQHSFFCVVHDITARKEIDRLKQEFIAMVSHDLRTPLTSMQFFLSNLANGSYGQLNETGMRKSALAGRNAAKLITMVNDLLDLERMESGQLHLELEEFALADIIQHSIESLRSFAERYKVNIEAAATQEKAYADQHRIEQVITNLLSNAIKFSPKDSTVSISVNKLGAWVETEVKDQGRGIPAHMQEAIFQRFKQVSPEDRREKQGSGLGLAISKVIVELHGGQIWVESQEGKGSTFHFRLPAGNNQS